MATTRGNLKMLNKFTVASLAAIWFSHAQADVSGQRATENTIALTNQSAWQIYEKYLSGWNTASKEEQAKIANDVVAEDVGYSTPRHSTGSRMTIIADMAVFQKKYPGGHFEVGDVSAHDNYALLTWVLILPDGKELARGHDAIRVSAEGKIVSVITFAPSVGKQ
jgi:hypothetical protein